MQEQSDSMPAYKKSPWIVDPYIELVNAARYIYQRCYEIYPEKAEQMQGVAIDRATYRGQLIFKERPILLPWESFITFEELLEDDEEQHDI